MANTVDNVKYFWADLPKWAKGLTIVAAIAIPSYIGWTIYQNKKAADALKKALEEQKQAESDLQHLIDKGIIPTLSDTDINQMISDILGTFEGCDIRKDDFNNWGVNPKNFKDASNSDYYSNSGRVALKVVNRMSNDADFAKMIALFAHRDYDDCWMSDGGKNVTFTSAMSNELTSGEIIALNTVIANKGITNKF